MARITNQQSYNGAVERIARLGLQGMWEELIQTLVGTDLRVMEEKDSNGGAAVREMLDERFKGLQGWEKKQSGGIDWTKCLIVNGTRVCMGVEIQFSGRSDLLIVDVVHLRESITNGSIDVGVIVTPSDRLSVFLTDRGPRFADANIAIKRAKAEDLPLILLGIEHDGPGPALPKKKTR